MHFSGCRKIHVGGAESLEEIRQHSFYTLLSVTVSSVVLCRLLVKLVVKTTLMEDTALKQQTAQQLITTQ